MTQIKQGKYYNIALIDPYTSKGPLFVQVTAIIKPASIELFGENNIRDKFFSESGILTYLSFVTENTDIYVCLPIKTTDPLEIDQGNTVFVPVSIIDFIESDEWRMKNRYSFNVEGITRYFENPLLEKAFSKSLSDKILDVLTNSADLGGDILSVSITGSEYLSSMNKILSENKLRNKVVMEKREVERNQETAEIERREYALSRQIALEEKIREYEILYAGIQAKENELHQVIAESSVFVQKQAEIKHYMSLIMDYMMWIMKTHGLSELLEDLPSWETIYNVFVLKKNNGVTLPDYSGNLVTVDGEEYDKLVWYGPLPAAPFQFGSDSDRGAVYFDLGNHQSGSGNSLRIYTGRAWIIFD
jgi:hypothetical protein